MTSNCLTRHKSAQSKGSNIGADSWSVDAEEEDLENRHNFQVTTT